MTVKELIDILKTLPQDAAVAYLHNIHGVILVEEVEHRECYSLYGTKMNTIVLSGAKEGD